MGDFTNTKSSDEVVEFIYDVHRNGLVSDSLSKTLINYRLAKTAAAVPSVHPAPTVSPSPAPAHPAFAPRRIPSPAPAPRPAPAGPATRPPRIPSRTEIWGRIAKKRTKQLWGDFAADFAANALTYLGVLLSVVVVFAFFAFGYFGELIDADHLGFRPLAEIGVVTFFLGLAWVLRHRTGIPQTSAAIEMIGIILIPVVMSASFRDGCTPSYQPWCLPPDVDGPGRWAAYGLVGLISTAIYYWYARRRSVYAYLVGPMLWVAVGAFALYLEDGLSLAGSGRSVQLADFTSDGISGAQLIAVLLSIGLAIAIATRIRHTRIGRTLSVPLVRSGVLATPFVLVLSFVFSHNDAVVRGIASPTLEDLAWPNFIAASVAAGLFVAARRATFAWKDLGKRTRRDLPAVLEAAALLSIAAAWLLTSGFGISVAWLGAGLVGYAVVVAVVSDGNRPMPTWLVRIAAVVGAAMALIDPGPTFVAWGVLTGASILRSVSMAAATKMKAFVPAPQLRTDRLVQMWAVALVATFWGVGRLGWAEGTPYLLLVATAAFVAARFGTNRDLRTFAGDPAAAAGLGSLATQTWLISDGSGPHLYVLSLYLLALAGLAAMSLIETRIRTVISVALTTAATMAAMRALVGSTAWQTAWIDTTLLGLVGMTLVAVYITRATTATFVGGIGYLAVALSVVRAAVFTETLILGLAVLAATYLNAAVRLDTDRRSVFLDLARRSDVEDQIMRHFPAAVGLSALVPLAAVVGIHWSLVGVELARFGPLFSALAGVYLLAAASKWETIRRVAVPLTYVAATVAIIVGSLSSTASIVTTASAAVVTGAIAVMTWRPMASIPSWILSIATVLLIASRVGVGIDDLYVTLHVATLVLAAGVLLAARMGVPRQWLIQPAGVAALVLPLTMLSSNVSSVLWIAGTSAVAYGGLGWVSKVGAFSFAVAGSLAAAFGGGLAGLGQSIDDPLVWMPLAVSFVALAAALPGRRSYDVVRHPAPGMLASGLLLGGLVVISASSEDTFAIALVCLAGLLTASYIVKRDIGWLVGVAASLVASGLAAGDGWAPLATFCLTITLGYLADSQRSEGWAPSFRGLAAASLSATIALVASWQQWTTLELLLCLSITGTVTLTAAAVAELATDWNFRIREWRLAALWLSQLAGLAMIATALNELDSAPAAGVIAAVVAFDAVAAAVVGTFRSDSTLVLGASILGVASYSLVPKWLEWSHQEFVIVTGVIAALLASIATAVTRKSFDTALARLWSWPLHLLPVAATTAIVVSSVSGETAADGLWTISLAFLGLAIYTAANEWAAPPQWQLRALSVASLVASAFGAMAAEIADRGAVAEITILAASTGLVAAAIAGIAAGGASPWRKELPWLAFGLNAVALGGSVVSSQTTAAHTGLVLVLVGTSLAVFGVLARNLVAVETALVSWLAAFFLLVGDQVGIGIHAAAVASSVVLLAVVELERVRREIDDLLRLEVLDQVEWALMLVPLLLAAGDMFESLWFGPVLLVEGLALAAWGTMTEVRRRALLGVTAMALSIVLSILLPALNGLIEGLAGGTWLAVGAVAAVVSILAGSTIEKQRHEIGRRLASIADILERWN